MVAILAACSLIFVCMVVLASLFDSDLPAYAGLTGSANATLYSSFAYASLDLGSMIPVVVLAFAIIGCFVLGARFFKASGALSE